MYVISFNSGETWCDWILTVEFSKNVWYGLNELDKIDLIKNK